MQGELIQEIRSFTVFDSLALIVTPPSLSVEILTARQKKAEELKRLTDLASQMAEMQIKVSSPGWDPGPSARDLVPTRFVLHPCGATL